MITVRRVVGLVSALALVVLVVAGYQLRTQFPPGYHKVDVGLAGQVPATVYFQDSPDAPAGFRPGIDQHASAASLRPGVVMVHGYGGDRRTMEGLAQSLTLAGYTVVSIDASGHGMNRNAYRDGWGAADHLAAGVRAGVRFLRETSGIDPARIVVLGHSMGARAALAYGSHQSVAAGLVMLSGSADFLGPQRLRNTLFLYAERELPGIEPSVGVVAAELAGVAAIAQRRTYGDMSQGTAVRVAQIPGTGHGTILVSPDAFAEIVHWLDQVTGFSVRSAAPVLVPRPLGAPLLWVSFLLVLPGLGLLLGRLGPQPDGFSSRPRWFDLAGLLAALLLPMAIITADRPGVFLGSSDADVNVTHLAVAGVLLLIGMSLFGRLHWTGRRILRVLAVAAVGLLAISALLGPVSANFHGVGLTPEKAGLTIWGFLCLAPFALGFHSLLFRERWWRGAVIRLAGRIAVLGAVGVGNAAGLFGFPGTIAVFVLLASTAIMEPLLAGFYGASRNPVAAAALDALVTAWLFALYLPSNF